MKRIVSVIAQFVLFLLVDAVGSIFYHPFGVVTKLQGTEAASRDFVWDGLILMFIAYLLVLAIHALRKKLRRSVPLSTAALLLATVVGYVLKLGFVTHNL